MHYQATDGRKKILIFLSNSQFQLVANHWICDAKIAIGGFGVLCV